jgi:cytochrome c556
VFDQTTQRETLMSLIRAAAVATALGALALPATAQDFANEVGARQGMFKIMGLNVGVLGGMARGNIPYDAEAAQVAAANLVAVSGLNPLNMFPAGSDNMSLDTTRAKPEIWENVADVGAKWAAYGEAAAALAAVAGTGQEAIGPALGALGASCQSCHEAYRGPEL